MIRSARMRSAASRRVSLASSGDKSRARDDATCKSIRTSLARRRPTLPVYSRISRIVSTDWSRRRLISCGVSFSISLAALINSEIKAGMEDMAGNCGCYATSMLRSSCSGQTIVEKRAQITMRQTASAILQAARSAAAAFL